MSGPVPPTGTSDPDDPYVINWAEARDRLATTAREESGWYAATAARLVGPNDRLAVDVGCGGGGMAIALTTALPTGARVLAIDGDDDVLAGARENAAKANVPTDRLELRRCDLHGGLDALRTAVPEPADVIWASAVVHHLGDQQAGVDALVARLAPGGRLAVAEGGLRPRVLPWDVGVGRPGLEMRLDAAQDAWFAGMRAALPASVPMPYGWDEALRRAGLAGVKSWSTLLEKPPPLPEDARIVVLAGLSHRVERLGETDLLDAEDVAAWQRLLDPGHPAWLGRRDDLFSLEARTVHVGTAAPAA